MRDWALQRSWTILLSAVLLASFVFQHRAVGRVSRRRQLREPVRAVDREDHRRHRDDVRDHRRRDRPVGCFRDGVRGLHRGRAPRAQRPAVRADPRHRPGRLGGRRSVPGAGDDADREFASGRRPPTRRAEQVVHGGFGQVPQHALEEELGLLLCEVAGVGEPLVEAGLGEVGLDEGDPGRGDVERVQPATLVGLCRGMVDLEEPDTGRTESERPPVIAGAEDHHLGDATIDGTDDRVVEEQRARLHEAEKSPECSSLAFREVDRPLDALRQRGRQGHVAFRVTGRGGRSLQPGSGQCHTSRRQGRFIGTHPPSPPRAPAPCRLRPAERSPWGSGTTRRGCAG